MARLITSKKLLFPNSKEDSGSSNGDDALQESLKDAKRSEVAENHRDATLQEIHQNRLNHIRKELLEHIKKTEWKYKPIETYIGQSDSQSEQHK